MMKIKIQWLNEIINDLLNESNHKGMIIEFYGMRKIKYPGKHYDFILEFRYPNIQIDTNFDIEIISDIKGHIMKYGISKQWNHPFEIMMTSSKLLTDNIRIYKYFKEIKNDWSGVFVFSSDNEIGCFINDSKENYDKLIMNIISNLNVFKEIELLCGKYTSTIQVYSINGEEFNKYYDLVTANISPYKILKIERKFSTCMNNNSNNMKDNNIHYLISKNSKIFSLGQEQNQKAKIKLSQLKQYCAIN